MARAAVPEQDDREDRGAAEGRRIAEPVWLVRTVLVLFLVGFAAFLAREVANLVRSLT